MNCKKMISVIVPVYNAGSFLAPLIRSILVQSEVDLELLLIDDGSKDGSGAVCDAFATEDGRVRVFHKENGGQSSARNLGLDNANGELIAFADHDDVLHPKLYETLKQAMDQTGAKVSACQFENTPNEKIQELDFTKPILPWETVPQQEIIHRFFTPAWHIPVWNKLYRREIVDKLRFHGAMLGEDNLFSYRVLKQCEFFAFCPSVMYFQRMHGNNFELTGLRYMVDLVRAKEVILQDIRSTFPAEFRGAQAKFLYESVRIYNLYSNTTRSESEEQRRQVLEIMRSNSNNLFRAKLPLGHKLAFCKLKWLRRSKIPETINI